ncbi:MAG: ABC transporter ATP-binding protein [Verrucomicrobiales bacterium]|nr:ABC transporter ATP-binding protein [Verrucomicrobiales bacterium]
MASPQDNSTPIRAVDIATASPEELAEVRRNVFRRLLGYITPFRMRLFWGILFGVLAGLINGVFLLVIKTVFAVVLPRPKEDGDAAEPPVDSVSEGSEGIPLQEAYYPFEDLPFLTDFAIRPPKLPDEYEWIFVLAVCLSIPVLLLIRGLFQYLHAYCMLWINMKVLYRLRDESFSSLISQPLAFFNRVKQGELIQTVSNQTRTSADAGSQLLSALITHPAAILSIIVMVVIMDPLYTFGALIVFPLCIVPVALVSRKVRKAGGKEEQESEGLMVTLHESFGGVRLVKAHSREDYQRNRFNEGSRSIIKFIMRWRKAMEISSPMVEIVGALGISIGLVYAWMMEVNVDTFTAINLGLISIYPHAKALSRMNISMQKCFVAALKVFSYIDAEPDVKDAPKAIEIENSKGKIEIDDVEFSYTEDRTALQGVSLTFESGKRYALVGQSGSGKSTILSLILRFYDPDKGSIRLDDRDIREYTQQSLRDQIGIVSQETFLFHDTILDNIRYGRLDATREEVVAAAKLAHAHEFIEQQSDGYDTVLGDKGCTLSGGQQQRLSIARAILRDAPILLLDEAMSALDSESEKAIQDAIEELSRGKTVIAIAHRLSTVLDSDGIVVMKEGRVIDVATHEVLLERCPEYQQLYQLQFET